LKKGREGGRGPDRAGVWNSSESHSVGMSDGVLREEIRFNEKETVSTLTKWLDGRSRKGEEVRRGRKAGFAGRPEQEKSKNR